MNALPSWLPRYRFTIAQMQKIIKAKIITTDLPIELIHGELITKTQKGNKHNPIIHYLHQFFLQTCPSFISIKQQQSLLLAKDSLPCPDILLLKPRADNYKKAYPRAEDVLLLIEVADTTFAYDSIIKIPLYAQYRIQHTWLIHVAHQKILTYSQAKHAKYQEEQVYEYDKIIELNKFLNFTYHDLEVKNLFF